MERVVVIMLCAILSMGLKAQTPAEWSRQNATQKKYLLQQIAALQVYIGYVQKGYSIARQGLNSISDIKNNEFSLHLDYLASLKTINPKIKSCSKVADIIALQVRIIKIYEGAAKQIKQNGSFTAGEITYINGIFKRLLEDCTKTVSDLLTVTAPDELQMKDNERLRRINTLYNDMQDNYIFVQAFSNETKRLAALRKREQNDIQTIRLLHGTKNQ